MGSINKDSSSEDAVQFYLQSGKDNYQISNKNYIYQTDAALSSQEIAKIIQIEVLDYKSKPATFVRTWDDVRIRIKYISNQRFDDGTIILDFSDFKHNRLLVFDSGNQVPIEIGINSVDCYIPKFPLASGEYYVGGGLAVSRNGFINEYRYDLGLIQIHGKDVFNLGRSPEQKRMLFVQEHSWKVSNENKTTSL